MTNSRSAFQQTVSALRERGINVKQEELQSLFDDPQTSKGATTWVENCLGETTLLSKEEVALYAKLESNGIAKNIASSHDLSTVKPILDDDLRHAISSLETSTAAIEKQTETLKLQWKHLETLTRRNRDTETQRVKQHGQLDRRHALEKQHIAVTTEDLFQDFKRKLGDSQDHAEKAARAVSLSTTDKLKEDDRTLRQLEVMADDTDLLTFQDKDVSSRTKKLTSKLVDYMTEEMECRLDRIYLETLHEPSRRPPGHEDQVQDASILKDELDSLYSEISALAEMAIQQEFKTPLIKAARDQGADLKANSDARWSYISRTLAHLLAHAEEKQTRLQNFAAHRRVLGALAVSFQKELPVLDSLQSQSPLKTNGRLISPSKGTLTTVEESRESQAFANLLRHLGISITSGGEVNSTGGEIREAVMEKIERLEGMIQRADNMVDLSVLAPLSAPEHALQLLCDALHADSKTELPNLLDRESDTLLSTLEESLQVVAKDIENIDMNALNQRDKVLERFLEKWTDVD